MGYGDNRGKNRGHRNESSGGRDSRNRRGGGYGGYRPPFGGGNRFPPVDAPVQVGKEYLVTIGELSRRGEGVAKISGFVIFVPGAKADAERKVKIRIDRVGPRFASGTIVEGQAVDETTEESSETADEENQESSDSDSMVEQV